MGENHEQEKDISSIGFNNNIITYRTRKNVIDIKSIENPGSSRILKGTLYYSIFTIRQTISAVSITISAKATAL